MSTVAKSTLLDIYMSSTRGYGYNILVTRPERSRNGAQTAAWTSACMQEEEEVSNSEAMF